jgi:hypothetical protein
VSSGPPKREDASATASGSGAGTGAGCSTFSGCPTTAGNAFSASRAAVPGGAASGDAIYTSVSSSSSSNTAFGVATGESTEMSASVSWHTSVAVAAGEDKKLRTPGFAASGGGSGGGTVAVVAAAAAAAFACFFGKGGGVDDEVGGPASKSADASAASWSVLFFTPTIALVVIGEKRSAERLSEGTCEAKLRAKRAAGERAKVDCGDSSSAPAVEGPPPALRRPPAADDTTLSVPASLVAGASATTTFTAAASSPSSNTGPPSTSDDAAVAASASAAAAAICSSNNCSEAVRERLPLPASPVRLGLAGSAVSSLSTSEPSPARFGVMSVLSMPGKGGSGSLSWCGGSKKNDGSGFATPLSSSLSSPGTFFDGLRGLPPPPPPLDLPLPLRFFALPADGRTEVASKLQL